MVWVRLDDRFPEDPDVAALNDRAFRAYVVGLCYCGRNETDGFIPEAIAPRGFRPLLEKGLWSQVEGGYRVRNFLKYNPSRTNLVTKREQAAERMRRVRANETRTSQEPVSTPAPAPSPKQALLEVQALAALEPRTHEDINAWARALAEDVKNASD